MRTRIRFPSGVIGQCLLGAVALGFLAFAPPARGRMTIVSLSGQSADEIARWAVVSGAVMVAAGSHSLTVEGSRATLMLRALSHGGVLLAARPGACGEAGRA